MCNLYLPKKVITTVLSCTKLNKKYMCLQVVLESFVKSVSRLVRFLQQQKQQQLQAAVMQLHTWHVWSYISCQTFTNPD